MNARERLEAFLMTQPGEVLGPDNPSNMSESTRPIGVVARADHSERPIIGWMVCSGAIEHAAMYNLSQREQAFDAARRWGASITAMQVADGCPTP